MQSKILEVLNVRFKQRILDFFKVGVYGDESFDELTMLLGEKSLIFTKKDEPPEELGKNVIHFDMIKQVVCAKNSFFVLRMDLFDAYFLGTPKVFIAINNRRDFLGKLRVAYTTFNLNSRLEARALPIFMDKLDSTTIKNLPKTSFFRMQKIHFYDTERWYQPEFQGYSFVLPRIFVSLEAQKNIFFLNTGNIYELDKTNFVSFQASRSIPLWAKESMSSKNSLEYYAYDLIIDWLNFKKKTFAIVESVVYQKRFKLTNDNSKWMGHYIKARSLENNEPTDERFYVAVFRRAYIPPLLDTFDDLVLMAHFNEGSEKPLIQLNTIDGRLVDENIKTERSDRIFLTMIDSVSSVEDQYPVPVDQLGQVINSLGKLA